MEEFEIYLVSNGSMQLFPENTLSSFTNVLSEPLSLQGEWRVALSEITTPALSKNVTETNFVRMQGLDFAGTYGWTTKGTYTLDGGLYHDLEELISQIQLASNIKVKWNLNPTNHKLSIEFHKGDGLIFPTNEIPNILGFKGMPVASGIRIGHKLYYDKVGKDKALEFSQFRLEGDYPVDLTGGRHITFVYINIIEYQSVADTKAPLLRLLPVDTRLKNGSISESFISDHRTFKDLQYKNLISNSIQSIKIELRNDIGELIPFVGSGRTSLTLKFQKVS